MDDLGEESVEEEVCEVFVFTESESDVSEECSALTRTDQHFVNLRPRKYRHKLINTYELIMQPYRHVIAILSKFKFQL